MKLPLPSKKKSTQTTTLENKNLLLVEGKDEIYFFEKLLSKMGFIHEVQIIDIGGVERMRERLEALVLMPNFEAVQSIGIVRDADDSVQSAEQSVRDLLAHLKLPVATSHNTFERDGNGLQVGVYIMPGRDISGRMLEDLCLKTIETEPFLPLIEQYLTDIESAGLQRPSNVAKAKVQIYLASQKKIVHSLGLGAQRGYWDLENSSLDELKQFLNKLAE